MVELVALVVDDTSALVLEPVQFRVEAVFGEVSSVVFVIAESSFDFVPANVSFLSAANVIFVILLTAAASLPLSSTCLFLGKRGRGNKDLEIFICGASLEYLLNGFISQNKTPCCNVQIPFRMPLCKVFNLKGKAVSP